MDMKGSDGMDRMCGAAVYRTTMHKMAMYGASPYEAAARGVAAAKVLHCLVLDRLVLDCLVVDHMALNRLTLERSGRERLKGAPTPKTTETTPQTTQPPQATEMTPPAPSETSLRAARDNTGRENKGAANPRSMLRAYRSSRVACRFLSPYRLSALRSLRAVRHQIVRRGVVGGALRSSTTVSDGWQDMEIETRQPHTVMTWSGAGRCSGAPPAA